MPGVSAEINVLNCQCRFKLWNYDCINSADSAPNGSKKHDKCVVTGIIELRPSVCRNATIQCPLINATSGKTENVYQPADL